MAMPDPPGPQPTPTPVPTAAQLLALSLSRLDDWIGQAKQDNAEHFDESATILDQIKTAQAVKDCFTWT